MIVWERLQDWEKEFDRKKRKKVDDMEFNEQYYENMVKLISEGK